MFLDTVAYNIALQSFVAAHLFLLKCALCIPINDTMNEMRARENEHTKRAYIYCLNEHIIKLALFIFHPWRALAQALLSQCWRIHKTPTLSATRVRTITHST